MKKRYPYLSKFRDRHGKIRWRFRRVGYPSAYIRATFGSDEFNRQYADCLAGRKITVDDFVPGSIDHAVNLYRQSSSYTSLRPVTRTVYDGVLRRFQADFGQFPLRSFDSGRLARIFNAMSDRPHAAARLRKLLALVFSVARVQKLISNQFNPIADAPAPRIPASDGYHRWTEDELLQFETRWPIGTRQRLVFDLLLYSGQRSADVRVFPADLINLQRININQSKTSNLVDIPIFDRLRNSILASNIGNEYLIENNKGLPYSAKTFYNFFKKSCVAAGLKHCAAHGLRKSAARRCYLAGCTDDEGMAITGHKSREIYRKYARDERVDQAAHADAAYAKILSNQSKKLDNSPSQTTDFEGV